MPKPGAVPLIPSTFRKRLHELRQQHQDLLGATEQVAVMCLKFCQLYHQVSLDAEDLPDDQRAAALHELEADFSHVDKSVRSKWRTIGQHAPRLLAKNIVQALPPTRDAIYELARLPPAKLAQLVRKGRLQSGLSIASTRALVAPKRRQSATQQSLASVTLSFATYGDAAKCLAVVLNARSLKRINAPSAFRSAIAAELQHDFVKVQQLFA